MSPAYQLNDIVITGIGLTTPLGLSACESFAALRELRSGIAPLTRFPRQGATAAAVAEFDVVPYLKNPKNGKFFSLGVRYAMRAVDDALRQSGLALEELDRRRVALHSGSGHTCLEYEEFFPALAVAWKDGAPRDFKSLGGRASRLIDAYFSLRTLSNSGVGLISAEYGFQGPGNNFVHSDTASAWALKSAAADLTEGRCDVAIAGGYDALVSRSVFLHYREAGLLSESGRMAAFARERDGVVLGEGAAFFVLERAVDAAQRGGQVLASLNAVVLRNQTASARFPACGLAALRSSLQTLLTDAPPAVVATHGIGTPDGDRQEAALLADLPVGTAHRASYKPFLGYMGAASATAELALAILGCREGFLPPAAPVGEPDPDLPGGPWSREPLNRALPGARCLALSSGWGGQAAAIVATVCAPVNGQGSA